MPASAWQRAAAKTRQPRLPKLVILPGTPCYACTHVKTSHSPHFVHAPCKVPGCGCFVFDPICGCGHLLCQHEWGTPPHPWACATCDCRSFGASMVVPA